MFEYRILSSAERGRPICVWLTEFVITNVLSNEYRHQVFQKWEPQKRAAVISQLRQLKHGEVGNITLDGSPFSSMVECRFRHR